MVLIANSFFLSFQTFWRYLVVMPFVLIPGILVIFSVLVVPLLVFGQFIVIGMLFAPFLIVGLLFIVSSFLIICFSSFNTMIGCRSAFAALGRMNELDFGRLMGKTFTFTLIQMAAAVFIGVVLGGVVAGVTLLSPGGGLSLRQLTVNPELVIVTLLANPIVLMSGVLMTMASLAISALLSVPMAGAAISATPKMGPTDAFLGLGTAFLPMMAILIVCSVLGTLTGAFAGIAALLAQIATMLAQYIASNPLTWMPLDQFAVNLGLTLLVIWSSCWFYTAAALGWKSYTDDRDAAIAMKVEEDRFSPDELRRLREKREQERDAGRSAH